MSLESEISSLRSEISSLERENKQLKNEINLMINSVSNASNSVSSAKETSLGALTNGEKIITNDDGILHRVDKKQVEIKQMMVLYKNMENAYKTIRRLNNDLRYHQNGEKNVRKMVVAMIDNEIKNLASEDTIAEQAEKQYIDTQYFFLSHIMMDLQLAKRGEPEAAERARKKALELDERRSTWVYFLIALRRGDEKATSYWLDKLVKKPLVGSEERFLKVLVVIAICDKGALAKKIRSYIGIDNITEEDKASFVSRISSNYSQVMSVRPPEFKYVNEHIGESKQLRTALFGAMNNESVSAYIQKLSGSSSSETRSQFYSDMFDELMEYCRSPKSDEIRTEIAYQEKIIESKGVIADAMEKKAKEDVILISNLNVEECLFKWLTGNENFAGKEEITEFSYGKFKSSYKRAYRDYVKSYRSRYTENLTLNIEEYSTQSSFKDVEEDEKKVEKYLVERCEKTKAEIKDTKFYLCEVFGALLLIAGIVLNFIPQITSPWNVFCLVIGVISGLALVLLGIKIKYANYKALIRADELLASDRIKYNEVLRCVYTDVNSYREMYALYNSKVMSEEQF